MTPSADSVFALPDELATKQDPLLTAADEHHLRRVAAALAANVTDHEERLADVRRQAGGRGQRALDRDQEVRRLSGRLRQLRRASLDACLGRMVATDGEVTYLGRIGLADADGHRLLVDWRTPAAEPFFAATALRPQGLASRRRYRWTQGQITDYWDEAFVPDPGHPVALDDDSAFLASLGGSRTGQMRDVLATLQSDQDAIIRSTSTGTLVVDGGPGTGKTVVALHRAAYLLHADPRLAAGRGGILFVGPHQPYLNYVADVLPSLGEDGVRTCTLADLVPGPADLPAEPDPAVAALKARAKMVHAIEPAVRVHEEPPSAGMLVETAWSEVWLSPEDWVEAFGAADPGAPHNEAREVIWEALLDLLTDKHEALDGGPAPAVIRQALDRHPALHDAIGGAWPILDPDDLVGDLWSVPAYLRHCAPWLSADEVRSLQRSDPHAWTVADRPLRDAARLRLGDPEAVRRSRRRKAAAAAQRAHMDDVVQHLLASDIHGDDVSPLPMLRGEDLRDALVDRSEDAPEPDGLIGPFAHVIVDEAQELTEAEWQMLLQRCPARSFTVVGDRAQARQGFAESWEERMARVGLRDVRRRSLTVNYRTPAEVMEAAAPVIRAVLPDANVPTSVRRSGSPVRHEPLSALGTLLDDWLAAHDGTACVIGAALPRAHPRVQALSPSLAKGLEFDLVVLVDPETFGAGITGAVDRYVAMTRATRELVVVSGSPA